jgi:hypothetical protein
MNKKAQSSFEMIMVLGVIFLLIVIVFGNFLSPLESFNASAQAKIATRNALNKYTNQPVQIMHIELEMPPLVIEDTKKYVFTIKTNPAGSDIWVVNGKDTAIEEITTKIENSLPSNRIIEVKFE